MQPSGAHEAHIRMSPGAFPSGGTVSALSFEHVITA